ncbi:MAG: hypothetical protein MRY83_00730, partial [Flavobacteriales bacterium]|nr:hypothetical protein [Flavobacteriales bacterium]
MHKEFQYISTQAGVDKCHSFLKKRDTIALDLEFDKNRYAYGFTLSMIQIFDGDDIYLIDALNETDLSGIFDILHSKQTQKIVYAFGEDIRLLHSLQCFPKNVYDLDICAKLLDFEPCSLSKLTSMVLGEI